MQFFGGFEIFIDVIPEPKQKATRTKSAPHLSDFQMVRCDFALVVDRSMEAGSIVRVALSSDKKLIDGVQVFDLF